MSDKRRILHEDRLVQIRRGSNGLASRRGKRVAANCPLTRDEIRIYVTKGLISVVKHIRATRGTSLADTWYLINLARYGTQQEWDATARERDEAKL